MAFTPLTNRTMTTTKRSSRNGKKISRVIVHHWAGTGGGVERLVHSTDKASANYIILSDGTLIGSVPEQYRAWTSDSAAADEPSITVEVQNATGGPDWKVSDAAVATLTRLIADVAKRHGWAKITREQVRGHREFSATACPGPYLYPRLDRIAADAEELRAAGGAKPKPSGGTYTVRKGDTLSGIAAAHKTTVAALVKANGIADPNKIEVGQKLKVTGAAAKPSTAKPTTTAVLKVGTRGTAVKRLQAELNRVFPAYSRLAVDGSFGPATEAVVAEFQRRSTLKADGIVGPRTRAALKQNGVTL